MTTTDNDRAGPVRLRYLKLDDEPALKGRLDDPATRAHAAREIMGRLGIARQPGETPLDAWFRVMAEENGLPVTRPTDRQIEQAIVADDDATVFVWRLAGAGAPAP